MMYLPYTYNSYLPVPLNIICYLERVTSSDIELTVTYKDLIDKDLDSYQVSFESYIVLYQVTYCIFVVIQYWN